MKKLKLPFGLILTTAASLATPVLGRAIDEAVAALHDRYGDALKLISSGMLGDAGKTGEQKLDTVIAALIAAALADGVEVVYDLAKAVAQRVYLDVKGEIETVAGMLLRKLRTLVA